MSDGQDAKLLYDGDETSVSMNADNVQGDESRPRADTENTIIDETNSGFAILRIGSWKAGAVNFAQSALGAGTLSMPYVMRRTGIVIGLLFLLFVGAVSSFTVRLLIMACNKLHVHTYEDLAEKIGGKPLRYVTAALVCLFSWGITISYVIAVGDIIHPLTKNFEHGRDFFQNKRATTVVFWGCFMLPLSLLRDITSLRYPSLFALVTLMYLILSMVIFAGTDKSAVWSDNVKYANFNVKMLEALPVLFFSYCCQCNSFEIYHEMRPGTVKRVGRAAMFAMLFATCCYGAAGVAGVAAFGDSTNSDILLSYTPTDHIYMIIAYLGFAFTITFSFPVCLFPMRDAMLQVLKLGNVYTCTTIQRIAVAGSLAASSLLIGLFVNKIVVVFDLVGGICGSSLAFTFPAIFALKSGAVTKENSGAPFYYLLWFIFGAGIFCGLFGTGISIYSMVEPSDSNSHHHHNGTVKTNFAGFAPVFN
uniref:Amino acid transporter transmembrane domain-containing protein n=1 Tax=Neobodo designis TaxID=312471 RepID=A0A7S1Q219_NEODS|mmetsp:Transcript_3011/g.9390  ORF Transcript_3011/g.9390 Transcript_3011/m.9390 type:complete len:476 (+) Transcript_3011:35-1462(+)